MQGIHSHPVLPDARFAAPMHTRANVQTHSPRQNRLLAGLSVDDYEHVLPRLEPMNMPLGWMMYGPGDRQKYLYFITEGLVSRLNVLANGTTAEFGLTGREGAIGLASVLHGGDTPGQASVVVAGYAYRLRSDEVSRYERDHISPLQILLLRYVMSVMTQAGLAAACHRHHSVIERLSTLILSAIGRMPTMELKLTQELIAAALGVRRESVTEAAGNLQGAGIIRYARGRITVLDRHALEAEACECYAVIRSEQDRLFPALNDFD